MIEDQLSHDERIRLECLAQAVQLRSGRGYLEVVDAAAGFEEFIQHGRKP